MSRISGPFVDYRVYIPWAETLRKAADAGMSVGDYIDATYNLPGATKETIDKIRELSVFEHPIRRVCEIGPGSGRYLEQTLGVCRPEYYEIYETDSDWAAWLERTYPVVRQPADGISLAATPSESIDLVHAHKVLPGQPSIVTCRYLIEMARVTRIGGKAVFDIVTEACLDDATLDAWLAAGGGYEHYPCLVPRQFAIDFMCRRDCMFDGSFVVAMKPGATEYLIFTKTGRRG